MKTKSNQGLREDSQVADARPTPLAIASDESQLSGRISKILGDESQASFSRRCGFSDTALRKYLAGAEPSVFRLVAMADAAGVTIEWLATGRGSMKRQATAPASAPQRFDDLRRLQATIEACETGLRQINRTLPPDKYAELVLAGYELMTEWEKPASRDNVVRFMRAAA